MKNLLHIALFCFAALLLFAPNSFAAVKSTSTTTGTMATYTTDATVSGPFTFKGSMKVLTKLTATTVGFRVVSGHSTGDMMYGATNTSGGYFQQSGTLASGTAFADFASWVSKGGSGS